MLASEDPVFVKAVQLLFSNKRDATEELRKLYSGAVAELQNSKSSHSSSTVLKKASNPKDINSKRQKDEMGTTVGGLGKKQKSDKFSAPDYDEHNTNPLKNKETKEKSEVAKPDKQNLQKWETSAWSKTPLPRSASSSSIKKYIEIDIFSGKSVEQPSVVKSGSLKTKPLAGSGNPGALADDNAEDIMYDNVLPDARPHQATGICVCCRSPNALVGNQLIECQECHKFYHQKCHKPSVSEEQCSDPRLVWYCFPCQRSLKKLTSVTGGGPTSATAMAGGSKAPDKARDQNVVSQPFKRLDAPGKSGAAPGQSLVGLASLAANVKPGTSKDTKPLPGAKHTSMKSVKESKGLFGMSSTLAASTSGHPSAVSEKRLQDLKKRANAKASERKGLPRI